MNLASRFEALKEAAENETRNVQRIEARIEVKKDEINSKKRELEEKGVQFSSFSELQGIISEKESRVLEMVEQMEQEMGISGDSLEDAEGIFDGVETEFDF